MATKLTDARFVKLASTLRNLPWLVAAAVAAFLVTRSAVPALERWRLGSIAPNPIDTLRTSRTHATGTQLRFIYFGKKSCPWCQREETKEIVRAAKAAIAALAEGHGMSFHSAGVGLDWSASDGIEYIMSVGSFDEVAAGYGWANAYAARYFWGDVAGKASVPQVVVLRRKIEAPDSLGTPSYTFSSEDLIARYVGLEELRIWQRTAFVLNKYLVTDGLER
jgi:hypothetical protein